MQIIENPDFSDLPPTAQNHFSAGSEISFFNLPEWYDIVARVGLDQNERPKIYYSDKGALVVCAAAKGNSRSLRGCCNMYSIDYSVLTGQRSNIRPFFAEFARACRGADSVLLPGMSAEEGVLADALGGFGDAGFIGKPFFSWGIWYEPISEGGFEAYLNARPSVLQNTWRRKLASLEKSASVAFRTTHDFDAESFISQYDDVYGRSWKEPEPFPSFMLELIRVGAKLGALRCGTLEVNGQPIAAQFWIVWRGRAIIYKLAYDEKWGKASPGTLLTMHMARHVLERDRLSEINFGRGDDDYKKLWMSARRKLWGIEAANLRTIPGLKLGARIAASKLRDRFKGMTSRS